MIGESPEIIPTQTNKTGQYSCERFKRSYIKWIQENPGIRIYLTTITWAFEKI
jgi:hypothetical protein